MVAAKEGKSLRSSLPNNSIVAVYTIGAVEVSNVLKNTTSKIGARRR